VKLSLVVVVAMLATSVCAEELRVGTVTIHALDVYSSEEAARGSMFRLADRLHRETDSGVIEQFLLFHEGEVYSQPLLEETERNLRTLPFLKAASVVASAPHDGVVDVTVTTQDSWTISPETHVGSEGGENTFGINLQESNLLGRGKMAEIGWSRGIDRDSLGIGYTDPAFFAPYWNAKLRYVMTSDGYERRLSVGRPFYSFTTPWATYGGFTSTRLVERLYHSGVESSRFDHTHRSIVASYGIARNPNAEQAGRVTAGLRFVDDDYTLLAGTAPESHAFRYLFLRYDSARNRFMKLNFVNKDLRYEDFDLGRQYSIEAAISPKFLNVPMTTGSLRLGAAGGKSINSNSFLLGAVALSSRYESGVENAIASASATYVLRSPAVYPRAFVARAVVNNGWRLDGNAQFYADGLTGLRGYHAYMFAGSRSAIINLEQRLYLGRELLQLASPGIVAFIDAGDAADHGLMLKVDAGIGIRIGLPRSPRNLLRIDLAFPMQNDPLGRKKPMISFSSGQAF
jgi:hypothetical protein